MPGAGLALCQPGPSRSISALHFVPTVLLLAVVISNPYPVAKKISSKETKP